MAHILLLVACLLAGWALSASGRVGEQAHQPINAVIIHVSLPAVTLRALHAFEFDRDHLLPVLMPWALFALGALLFWVLGRALALTRAQMGALTLVGGLGNTSFVGLPMIEALQGRDGLGLGLLIDQLGSYLALSTLGVGAAALYAAGPRVSGREMARRVLTFPPVIALMVALALRPLPLAQPLESALARIGDTLAPLALLSVGMQLRLGAVREHARALALGLSYKLVLAPALVVGLLWLLDAAPDMTSRVSVIEAAMPPMIGAGIVAAQANLAPRLVSMMVGVGIPLGLLTSTGWHWLFGCLAG
ncbi:MAG: AEC family transporter [Rubrivivax sp.]|nr:AEC family transporter [Rubrivivax sp.]